MRKIAHNIIQCSHDAIACLYDMQRSMAWCAGVGDHRPCIRSENMGVEVISVGIASYNYSSSNSFCGVHCGPLRDMKSGVVKLEIVYI